MAEDSEPPVAGVEGELIPDDPVLGQLTRSAVGFLKEVRDEEGKRALIPCGSGSLVSVGGVRGILTAGHVIRELKAGGGAAALFTITKVPGRARNLEFLLKDCETVVIGGEEPRKDGPDLGFLRPSIAIEESLVAENVFYNFDLRLLEAEAGTGDAALSHDVVVGMMEERSLFKARSATTRTDTHTLSHAYCDASDFRDGSKPGFDIFDIEIAHSPDVPKPGHSYGGLSGAGIWRVSDTPGASNRFIIGVAFYETPKDERGHRKIVCHGPRCIYRELAGELADAFPTFKRGG